VPAAAYADPGVFADAADQYAAKIREKIEASKREAIAATKQTTI
jgi:hypothetical protein